MMTEQRKPNRRKSPDERPQRQVPKEASVVDSIMRFLKKLPNCKAEKTHGGFYGHSGKPDITGCLNGRRFEIEVKQPGKKPTQIQLKHLHEWREAGALVGWATSVEEAARILELDEDVLEQIGRRTGTRKK